MFAMFTDAGNREVAAIVETAKVNKLKWPAVQAMLSDLSDVDGFGEAMDTAVRECVYDALSMSEDFYI